MLLQIRQQFPNAAQQAAAESELYRQLLQRMVDDRIEQVSAEHAHLNVTSDEIDAGLRNVASAQGMTPDRLFEEARKAGLSVQEYRAEIRRQILEGKLLQLRVRGRVRVTDDDVKSTYVRLVNAERRKLSYRLEWIVLRMPADLGPAARTERETLAASLVTTARAGVDAYGRTITFGTLARSFSDDTPTRSRGGDVGTRRPGELAQPIEDEAMKLDVGEVSSPFRYKDGLVIVKVVEREASQLPSLADAHDQIMQRAYGEQMERARRQWLDEQRRSMYIDVRL